MLRPYKSWRHRYLWFKDPDLKNYLLEHMQRVPYRGFGEFHVFGKDSDTPQMEDMIVSVNALQGLPFRHVAVPSVGLPQH